MNIIKPQPQEISLKANVGLDTKLIDRRIRTGGIFFGTVGDVARNLGIKITSGKGYSIFTAPKVRLQLFCEKLHFSGIPFQEI